MRRALPLTAWAGLLTAGAVALAVGATALALRATGSLDRPALAALAFGSLAGLGVCAAAVRAASRVSAGLCALREAAVQRLHEPSAPLSQAPPPVAVLGREVGDLAQVLQALHVRVRVADQVGEGHRVDAETAGAGVSELLSGLVTAEEGARGQLAAELHDTVAQSLMSARSLLAGDRARLDLGRLTDHVEDAEEQVRAVMARTRPPALQDSDLAGAVGNLRLDMGARYGLRVHVRWPSAPHPLPLATAITVYRFFQEALLNVVKHADVDDAYVELVVEPDCVRVCVRDEGPGFEPEAVRPERGRHVGLGLLRERARLSGGSLEISCGDRGGTTLTLRLPRAPAGRLPPHGQVRSDVVPVQVRPDHLQPARRLVA